MLDYTASVLGGSKIVVIEDDTDKNHRLDTGYINQLADETILNIFSFFKSEPKTLGFISRVCKRWNSIFQDDTLWLEIYNEKPFKNLVVYTNAAKSVFKTNSSRTELKKRG